MKAAWDWHLPMETEAEQRAVVEFAHALGFDTLIVPGPTGAMARRGEALGVRVIAIVYARPTEAFVKDHPACLQRTLPEEEEVAAALSRAPAGYQHLSHRWFQVVQDGDLLCFEHPESREALKGRVSRALEVADGVSFDGFGFLNHYACFCDRCRKMRAGQASDGAHEAEVLGRMSEESLVALSRMLYAHAKDVKPDALVTNHVWPPFRPNWYYGCRLRLDYCTQTISWFYKPNWSLEQVAFEAAEHKRLEDRRANRFVPFIGLYGDPYLVRPPERVAKELEIAAHYGDGHVVLCNLETPKQYPKIAEVVKAALRGM